mmetsp:Transcript_25191/g.45588  ORF Transcript_25191/g.45588 Transcript_25191/m.45588 type:complete len:222 (+) Transcript_25191:498-1163(+)
MQTKARIARITEPLASLSARFAQQCLDLYKLRLCANVSPDPNVVIVIKRLEWRGNKLKAVINHHISTEVKADQQLAGIACFHIPVIRSTCRVGVSIRGGSGSGSERNAPKPRPGLGQRGTKVALVIILRASILLVELCIIDAIVSRMRPGKLNVVRVGPVIIGLVPTNGIRWMVVCWVHHGHSGQFPVHVAAWVHGCARDEQMLLMLIILLHMNMAVGKHW